MHISDRRPTRERGFGSVLRAHSTRFAVPSLADEVFQAQKKFFVDASKSFRDDRAASIYPGKILRRVEVTRCELLPDSGGPES